MRAAHKTVSFVTNDSRLSPEEYVRKLWSLGMQASLEEVVTVGAAIQFLLAGRGFGVPTFVIGSPAIFRHVAESGQRVVNGTPQRRRRREIVVVAGHDGFDFAELRTATQAVLGGAEMIAADRDRTFPAADGQWPGTGAIVAALEYATRATARSVGKPEPMIFETALDRVGPGRALMVGDRLDSDLRRRGRGRYRRRDRADRRHRPRAGRGGHRPQAGRDRRHPPRASSPREAVDHRQSRPPGAAGPAARWTACATRLTELELEHHVEETRSLDHARELARAATAAGEAAVAFGGDGLIGAVADALRRDGGLLGVLPGGRGNDFARVLGIPLDAVDACQVLAGGVDPRAGPRRGRRTHVHRDRQLRL